MRITNQQREAILNNAMLDKNKQFRKEKDDFQKEENDLAQIGYEFIFDQQLRSLAKKLPVKWLRKDTCLRFNVNGMTMIFTHKAGVPVPSGEYGGCSTLGVIQGELADRMIDYQGRKKDLEEKYRQIRVRLNALLNSCTTLKALQDTWPDGKPFYDFLERKSAVEKCGLPAVLVSEINADLGIGGAK